VDEQRIAAAPMRAVSWRMGVRSMSLIDMCRTAMSWLRLGYAGSGDAGVAQCGLENIRDLVCLRVAAAAGHPELSDVADAQLERSHWESGHGPAMAIPRRKVFRLRSASAPRHPQKPWGRRTIPINTGGCYRRSRTFRRLSPDLPGLVFARCHTPLLSDPQDDLMQPLDLGFCWWAGVGFDQRRLSRRFYREHPLGIRGALRPGVKLP
jgi:hypothetical protein